MTRRLLTSSSQMRRVSCGSFDNTMRAADGAAPDDDIAESVQKTADNASTIDRLRFSREP
jgi:hypothetical protein